MYISQILLAVVAIFGYFYTVLPVYQKDRLAEQVAKYEGIIKKQEPKIAKAKTRLVALQNEKEKLKNEMQRELTLLAQELKNTKSQLSEARKQKNKIENQIQFMTFRYRLPDGSPAMTKKQVRTAQVSELKRSFISSILECCRSKLNPFAHGYMRANKENKSWPFADQEISIWESFSTKFPLKFVIDCIDSTASRLSQQYWGGKDNFSQNIKDFRKEAIQYANNMGTAPWIPPMRPTDILHELTTKRSIIQTELETELKKIEEGAEGEVQKEMDKISAEFKATDKRLLLDVKIMKKVDILRSSIGEEIRRLTNSNFKFDSGIRIKIKEEP